MSSSESAAAPRPSRRPGIKPPLRVAPSAGFPAPGNTPPAEDRVVHRPVQGRVKAVRSTLIQSSLQTLRNRGYYDRYVPHLPPEYREVVLNTLEPTWIPLEAALAHYRACEALDLSEQEQLDMGTAVGERVQGSFLATLARTGKSLGATPWIILMNLDRLWDRTFQGGGCACYKLSPKDARCELLELPLASVPYFRNAYRGVFIVAMNMFAQRAFCSVMASRSGPEQLCFKVSWA
jgi:hypothetical protein